MPTLTPIYEFNQPDVASPTDEDIWGDQLNANWGNADSLINTATNTISRSVSSSPVTTDNTDRNKIILVDATSGDITVDLLAAATAGDGFNVTVKKTDSTENTVTIDANASETIDGESTLIISSQYTSFSLVCDGSNWFIKEGSRESVNTPTRVLLESFQASDVGEIEFNTSGSLDTTTYDTFEIEYNVENTQDLAVLMRVAGEANYQSSGYSNIRTILQYGGSGAVIQAEGESSGSTSVRIDNGPGGVTLNYLRTGNFRLYNTPQGTLNVTIVGTTTTQNSTDTFQVNFNGGITTPGEVGIDGIKIVTLGQVQENINGVVSLYGIVR